MSPQVSQDMALVVRDLFVRYGHVSAVEGVSLEVPSGATVAILGANGAGKSSTLGALSGSSVGSVTGEIELFGTAVKAKSAHHMARLGVSLVPEGRRMFAPLTVEENLLLGGYRHRSMKRTRQLVTEAYDLFPILAERSNAMAGLLSGGEQQMLAFGRAMMADPKLILMDEPSMGLAPIMVDKVFEAIKQINSRGTSILLVEQNAAAALNCASYAYVLRQGQIVHSGSSQDMRENPVVAHAFLGDHVEERSSGAA